MEWISIKEKLPRIEEYSYHVLVWQIDTILCTDIAFIAIWNGEKFIHEDGEYCQMDVISHWCYLTNPNQPERSKREDS